MSARERAEDLANELVVEAAVIVGPGLQRFQIGQVSNLISLNYVLCFRQTRLVDIRGLNRIAVTL
jgi:hypothetical protein